MYYIHYDYSNKKFRKLKDLRNSLPPVYNSWLDGRYIINSDKPDFVRFLRFKKNKWVLSKN